MYEVISQKSYNKSIFHYKNSCLTKSEQNATVKRQ